MQFTLDFVAAPSQHGPVKLKVCSMQIMTFWLQRCLMFMGMLEWALALDHPGLELQGSHVSASIGAGLNVGRSHSIRACLTCSTVSQNGIIEQQPATPGDCAVIQGHEKDKRGRRGGGGCSLPAAWGPCCPCNAPASFHSVCW